MSESDYAATVRERRAGARRRILDAAAALVEERPWDDIALDEVMARAELSRTTFYRHFAERSDLLLALLEASGVGADDAGALWKDSVDDPFAAVRAGLDALTAFHVAHGRLLRAVTEAAAHEPEFRAAYRALADGFVRSTAARIEADRAAGHNAIEDPVEVARALVWMNERYLQDCFGHHPFRTTPDAAAAALTEIWVATVYGRSPPPSRSQSTTSEHPS